MLPPTVKIRAVKSHSKPNAIETERWSISTCAQEVRNKALRLYVVRQLYFYNYGTFYIVMSALLRNTKLLQNKIIIIKFVFTCFLNFLAIIFRIAL